MGHVQLQEVVEAIERRRIQRVDVRAVGEREPLLGGAREVLCQIGAVPAGLLVLPLAGHERRHLDVLDERDRIERVGDLRVVGRVGFDLVEQVGGLAVQRLVGLAGFVAFFDLLRRPCLPVSGAGRFGVLLALLGPFDREAGVEDAARVERGRCRIDHRQRRDRREAGGLGLGREQLADAAVGDAEHPDLAALHPRLVGDRFDHVVAVEVLQLFEEVKSAAGAPGAAHVHVDDREAHQVGEDRDAVFGPGGVGVAVARVLDQRRVGRRVAGRRHAGDRQGREVEHGRHAGLARRARRRVHVDRELRAVARGQVGVAVVGDFLFVDAGVPRRRGALVDGDRCRLFAAAAHAVLLAGLHFAEEDAALFVGVLRGNGLLPFRSDACAFGARPVASTCSTLPCTSKAEALAATGGSRRDREDRGDRDPSRAAAGRLRATDSTVNACSSDTQHISPCICAHAQSRKPRPVPSPLDRHQLERRQ